MNNPEVFANLFTTALRADITTAPAPNTVETIHVVAAAPIALQRPGRQFRISIDSETMIVDGGSANTNDWSVTRGAEGTTPTTHTSGTSVRHPLTAGALDNAYARLGDDFTVGGPNGSSLAPSVAQVAADYASGKIALVNSLTSQLDVLHTKVSGTQTNFPVAADFSVLGAPSGSSAQFSLSGAPLTSVTELQGGPVHGRDAGWCWFNHPRCLAVKGLDGHSYIYTSYVGKRGDVVVNQLNVDTGVSTPFVLHAAFENDDHDVPGLIRMYDGTIMAFYTKHTNGDQYIRVRRQVTPDNNSSWTTETLMTVVANACYPYPCNLTSEASGANHGRMYLLFRGGPDLGHYVVTADDDGAAWQAGGDFSAGVKEWFSNRTQYPIIIQRPYFHIIDDGVGRIDMVFTDGHPREYDPPGTSLYHAYYQSGSLHKSDGTAISTIAALPATGIEITSRLQTTIQDVSVAGKCWSWDAVRNATTGEINVVFAVIPRNQTPEAANHYYWHGRFTPSTGWSTHQITYEGGWLPIGNEQQYSGGIAIDTVDPTHVYLSRQTQGTEDVDSTFDIEMWATPDHGATWNRVQSITAGLGKVVGCAMKACRPSTPRNLVALPSLTPRVFWTEGRFTSYTSYDMVMVYSPGPSGVQKKSIARAQVPSINSSADTLVTLKLSDPSVAPAQGNPFDANVLGHLPLWGRDFTNGDYFQSLNIQDLRGLTQFAVSCRFRVTNRQANGTPTDGNPDYLVSNWDGSATHAVFLLRVGTSGRMEGFVSCTGGQVGGTFAMPGDAAPFVADGNLHTAYLAYDTTNGLRLWVDGVQATTVFAANGALHGTAAIQQTEIGQSPHVPSTTRALYGSIDTVEFENVVRSSSWIATKAADLNGLSVVLALSNGVQALVAGNNLSEVGNPALALGNLGGAPLASPVLTGTPTAPTQPITEESTRLATTSYVANKVSIVRQNGRAAIMAPSAPGVAINASVAITAQRLYMLRFVPSTDLSVVNVGFWLGSTSSTDDPVIAGILDGTGVVLAKSGSTTGKLNTGSQSMQKVPVAYPCQAGSVYYASFLAPNATFGTQPFLLEATFGAANQYGGIYGTGYGSADMLYLNTQTGLPNVGSAVPAPTGVICPSIALFLFTN